MMDVHEFFNEDLRDACIEFLTRQPNPIQISAKPSTPVAPEAAYANYLASLLVHYGNRVNLSDSESDKRRSQACLQLLTEISAMFEATFPGVRCGYGLEPSRHSDDRAEP